MLILLKYITKNLFHIILFFSIINFNSLFIKKEKIKKSILTISSFLFSISFCFFLFFNQKNMQINLYNRSFLDQYFVIKLTLDSFDILYSLIIIILYPFAIFYGVFYFKIKEQKLPNSSFFLLIFISVVISIFIILSKNLILTFCFYELLTITTYFLVISDNSSKSIESAKTYFLILIGTSLLFFIPAILLSYDIFGTFNLSKNISTNIAPISNLTKYILISLFVFGISKIAFPPFHSWLINAMVAPVPISALLHAVLVVKIGIFILVKVMINLFPFNFLHDLHKLFNLNYLTIYSVFVFFFSGINAHVNTIIKKKLAYSTINQLSFIVLILSYNPIQMLPFVLFYTINHSLCKINLFFFAGELQIKDKIISVENIRNAKNVNLLSKIYIVISSINLIALPCTIGYNLKYAISKLSINFEEKNYLFWLFISFSSITTFIYLKDIILNISFSRFNFNRKIESYLISLPGFIISIIQIIILIKFEKIIKYFEIILK